MCWKLRMRNVKLLDQKLRDLSKKDQHKRQKRMKHERKYRKKDAQQPHQANDQQEVVQRRKMEMRKKKTPIKAKEREDQHQLVKENVFMIENLELAEGKKFPKEEQEKQVGEPSKMR